MTSAPNRMHSSDDIIGNVWQYVLGRGERKTSLGYDYLVKLMLIGDSHVGKSCMLLRFAEGSYNPKHAATIGVDYKSRTLEMDGKRAKIQIWDTAGHERFRSITQSYYRSAMGILVVFDLTNKRSFNNIRSWLEEVREGAAENVRIILVGNKSDMKDRQVDRESCQQLADEYGVAYFETSAKTGEGINAAFVHLTRQVVEYIMQVEKELAGSQGRSSVNAALQEGELDTVQVLSSNDRAQPRRVVMQFHRYQIDDYLDSFCEI